jgi:hypothetical protein
MRRSGAYESYIMIFNACSKAVIAPQSPAIAAGADLRALELLLTRP